MATDGGSPQRVSYETVVFTVNRNLNTPFWVTPGSNVNYQATTSVLESTGFGNTVYDLQANDQDVSVSILTCMSKMNKFSLDS